MNLYFPPVNYRAKCSKTYSINPLLIRMCVPRPMLANCFMNAKVSRLVGNVLSSGITFLFCWKIGKKNLFHGECIGVSLYTCDCVRIWFDNRVSRVYSCFVPTTVLYVKTGKIVAIEAKWCKVMRKDS